MTFGNSMQCVICKNGETAPGTTTVTVDRNELTVVLRHVPAEVCQTCGSDYLRAEVMAQVEKMVERAADQGTLVEIREFAA